MIQNIVVDTLYPPSSLYSVSLYILLYLETGVLRRGDEVLQADGVAYIGACVNDRQILINKEMPVVSSSAVLDNAGSLSLNVNTPENAVNSMSCNLFCAFSLNTELIMKILVGNIQYKIHSFLLVL